MLLRRESSKKSDKGSTFRLFKRWNSSKSKGDGAAPVAPKSAAKLGKEKAEKAQRDRMDTGVVLKQHSKVGSTSRPSSHGYDRGGSSNPSAQCERATSLWSILEEFQEHA